MSTKYRGCRIELNEAGADELYDVFIGETFWYGTVKGEENALGCARAYIDEIIDVKQHDEHPEESNHDEALEWGGVNEP